MSVDGIKVLFIGKCWKTGHEFRHLEETAHIFETIATFRPDVIVTSTFIPGVLQGAAHELRKRWINIDVNSTDEAATSAIEACYGFNIWSENQFTKDHPLVSVFTPTYNTGDYLWDTYQSLREQQYPSWEWVVVDDHSSDKTWEGLQEIAAHDFRVRPFQSGYRVGKIGATKNLATRLCRGVYLVELDHDDLLTDIALLEVKNAFEANPEVGFVYSNSASFFENGSPQRFQGSEPWDAPDRYREVIYKGRKYLECKNPDIYDRFGPDPTHQFGWFLTVGPHHIRSFRASTFWQLGGYNPELPIADDWDLYARFFLRSYCYHVDKLLYLYRYRDAYGNATFSKNKSIQDHLGLGRNHYYKEFVEFNQKRLSGEIHPEQIQARSRSNEQVPATTQGLKAPSPSGEKVVSFIVLDAQGRDQGKEKPEQSNVYKCLKSIRKHQGDGYRTEVILVENGVTSNDLARQLSNKVVHADFNLGFAAGCNLGASVATGQYLCFINDDAKLVDKETIQRMISVVDANCIAGVYSNRAKPPQGDWDKAQEASLKLPMVVGLCMLIAKPLFEKLNGFDPRFLTWEDDDICRRARVQFGVDSVLVGGTFVFHKGHQTFDAMKLDHVKVEETNQKLYQIKHQKIKVIAIAKNEAACVQDMYTQFRDITTDWYLLDTGSIDDTVEKAKAIGVKTATMEFTDFADARNKALALFDPDNDSWIIMIDPDERIDKATIANTPELLFVNRDRYDVFLTPLTAIYPNGSRKSFVPKPYLFRNRPDFFWSFKVHEKWIARGRHALIANSCNSHMLQYHSTKHRDGAESLYAKLQSEEKYFTDPEYKKKMRDSYPILDYDRVEDPRIEPILVGPLVSVVIPTYKRPELLEKAIASVLAQTWFTLEVLVVGDNCPDLAKILAEPAKTGIWADPRVRVWNLPTNNGAGGAVPRNFGICMAASPWIAYLDDDNTWDRDHLEKLFSTILREETAWGWSSMKVNGKDLKFDRLERGRIDTSCVIHRRELITKYGPWKNRTEANYWHDFELFSRWAREPQTVTKYPSVNYNAVTSGQEAFLDQLAIQRSNETSKRPKFSVLIASVESRAEMLQKLVDHLNQQCSKLLNWNPESPDVEIITMVDNGGMILGEKRNALIDKANGEYLAFIDDDDWVADTYIEDILNAISSSPDCVTFKGIVTTDGINPEEFRFDMNYPHNTWAKDQNGVHMRCPATWCPIKSEIAKPIRFMSIDVAEDRVWAIMLYPKLNTQVFIDKHLYHYKSSTTGTVAQQADKVARSKAIIDGYRFVPFVRK